VRCFIEVVAFWTAQLQGTFGAQGAQTWPEMHEKGVKYFWEGLGTYGLVADLPGGRPVHNICFKWPVPRQTWDRRLRKSGNGEYDYTTTS